MSVALDPPVLVVGRLDLQEGLAQVLDRVEPAHPEQVLLQCQDEPFRAAVALGRTNEGGGVPGAGESNLALEVWTSSGRLVRVLCFDDVGGPFERGTCAPFELLRRSNSARRRRKNPS